MKEQKLQKIILFGGTFDPPHNGHMTLLSAAIEAVRPDLVIVEPAGIPPHKRAGKTAARHRIAMCGCFCALCENLIIDDTEICRAGKSYTVDTVRTMNERYPGAQLYFPMGSDMLLWFHNWVGYRELLQRLVLVAHVRAGEDAAPMRAFAETLRAEGGSVLLTNAEVLPLSSTEIREKAARGEPIDALVPKSVAAYIAAHGLYRKQSGTAEGKTALEQSGAAEGKTALEQSGAAKGRTPSQAAEYGAKHGIKKGGRAQ